MSNMGYCRFENTLNDLRDCWEHWDDIDKDSEEEHRAQEKMLKLCQRIVNNYSEEDC